MTFYRRKTSDGEVVSTNIPDNFNESGYAIREFRIGDGVIEFITDDLELVKRSKILRKVVEVSSPIISSIEDGFIDQIKEHSHSLIKLQGQLKQKIEGIVDYRKFANKDFQEQREIVIADIKADTKGVADILINLQQRIVEIDAHMASFEIINMGEEIQLDIRPHNIRDIIIKVLHAFEDQSNKTWVKPSFWFADSMAEANKIKLDYKTINTALYNFLDNAFKYVKPNSDIRFYFEIEGGEFKLTIGMISLRIEPEELTKIFNLRFRGKHAKGIDGLGIGMYVVKRALELNSFRIQANADYGHVEIFDNRQYILNRFEISGRL
jgi:signal transduction histidine kinase